MTETDQVFLDNDNKNDGELLVNPKVDLENSETKLKDSKTDNNASTNSNDESISLNTDKPVDTACLVKKEDPSQASCRVKQTQKTLKQNSCKEEDDTKLKQSENGTLLSRGGEFEPDPSANQSDSVLDDIQTNSDIKFFICGSCKYNPILIGSVPKLLPCLHSFCENCLQKRYEIQKLSSSESGTPRLKCPSCGQEFLVAGNDKPTSAFLNNQFVIESTPNKVKCGKGVQEDHQCTSCEDGSKASSYCMNCNEWLCDACVNAHQRVKVTKDHIIQSKSSTSGESSSTDETKHKPLYCKIHTQEQLRLFCANCEKLTCRDCQLIEHKDHRYQFIDEAASRHREILKKLLQYLQINLGLLKDTISDVETVSSGLSVQEKEIENEINKSFNTLILSIKSRQEALVKDLHSTVLSKQVLLNKQKKDLTQMKIILEHNHDFADFAVKGGSNVALLYSRKVLGTRLHNLNSLKYRQRPLASLDLRFNLDVEKLQNYFSKIGSIFSQEDIQRKIENTGNTTTNSSLFGRTVALTSNRNQSVNRNSDSLSLLKRTLESSSQQQPSTKYINLSKQGLGLQGHQMIRAAAQNMNNSSGSHRSSPGGGQEMIVLSSPHSSRPYYTVQDGKIRQHQSKYGLQTSSIRDQYHRDPHVSPKTPSESFLFHGNHSRSAHSSITSPISEQSQIHWPKISNEHSLKAKKVSNDEFMQRLADYQPSRKPTDSTSSVTPRLSSTKSNGSEGSATSLNEINVNVKQEEKHESSCQGFTNVSEKALKQQQRPEEARSERSESGFDEGQNEDYCGVCRNGGELLCCDTCPKVYHLHCHVPSLNSLPSDSWSCYLCTSIGSETSTNLGAKRKHSDELTDWEKKLCQKILLKLFVHVDSLPFHHKVSKAQAPDYYKVITRPMDLNTILTKLSPQHFEHYQSLESFIGDIRLLFSNCFVYNSAESEVCKMGRRLESFFNNLLRKYVPQENHFPDTEGKLKQIRTDNPGVF